MSKPLPLALLDAFTHHAETAETADDLAIIAGLPVAEVQAALDDPQRARELQAHRAAYLRPGRAGLILDKVLDRIEAQLEKGVDGFEAAELGKPLIKILENSERVRLAEVAKKDPYAGLPVFQFIFGSSMRIERVQPAPSSFIDVEVVTVEAVDQAAE